MGDARPRPDPAGFGDMPSEFFALAHEVKRLANARYQGSGLSMARLMVLHELVEFPARNPREIRHGRKDLPGVVGAHRAVLERQGQELVDQHRPRAPPQAHRPRPPPSHPADRRALRHDAVLHASSTLERTMPGTTDLGAFSISLTVAGLAVSRDFYERLGLEVGKEVVVVIKASEVILGVE